MAYSLSLLLFRCGYSLTPYAAANKKSDCIQNRQMTEFITASCGNGYFLSVIAIFG